MVESTNAARRVWSAGRGAFQALWLIWLVWGALLALHLGFFALHAVQIVRYPFPLDYGEGPLLAQVNLLRSGVSLRELYGPLDAPPFIVVNYPPVYLLATYLASFLTNNVLLAGRLVSLLATFACVGALWALTRKPRTKNQEPHPFRFLALGSWFLFPLAFLALPIVREWAVLMRVDMLGVALGLWGLVALRAEFKVQSPKFISKAMLLAVLLLTLSLFTKPSLIAAPTAAFVGLLLFNWRRACVFAISMALLGGAAFGILALNSNFVQHVVVANANAWESALAAAFWQQVITIHWPLFLAAALGVVLAAYQQPKHERISTWVMPLVYALGGVVTAIGVGKVGAYLNYFLELYVGLVWLIVLGMTIAVSGQRSAVRDQGPALSAPPLQRSSAPTLYRSTAQTLLRSFALPLLALALVRYYPMWSETTTRLAGVIEGENPPRLVVGQRGVWQDLRRERQILRTMERTNATLVQEVQAANGTILTDIPGVAAQAGQIGRLQAFEHSQIPQLWNQRDLRLDLVNGRVPLVVLDYLGNWLSADVIALIKHRYAQQGSRGSYDLYRPIDLGAGRATDLRWQNGLRLAAIHGVDQPYHAGELFHATLLWNLEPGSTFHARHSIVHMALRDAQDATVARSALPFTYGAVSAFEIPPEGVQHMQTLRMPVDAMPGTYTLSIAIEAMGGETVTQDVATITVEPQTGAILPNGWITDAAPEYVPQLLYKAWQHYGGEARFGMPITPAVPLATGTQQCFERGCLRLEGNTVVQVPVGEWLAAGDVGANGMFSEPTISAAFQSFYAQHGGAAALGTAVTNEFRSGDRMVQYTQYARLERPLNGGEAFGNIGEDVLRLPVGVPYRWP